MVLGVPWLPRLIHIFEKHTALIFSWSSPEGNLGPKEPSCAIANGPGFALGSLVCSLGALRGAPCELLGSSWELLGNSLGPLRCSLEALGSSWQAPGCSLEALGTSLEAPEGSWELLGRSWGLLGTPWELLEVPWSFLGALWALLGRSWGFLGSSWVLLESSLGALGKASKSRQRKNLEFRYVQKLKHFLKNHRHERYWVQFAILGRLQGGNCHLSRHIFWGGPGAQRGAVADPWSLSSAP